MNRKADFKMGYKAIIGLVISLIILFVLVIPSGELIAKLLFPEDTRVENSFESLDISVSNLALNGTDSVPFYLEKNRMLVAFDKSANSFSGDLEVYDRPAGCYNKACLVLCRNNGNSDACIGSEMVLAYDGIDEFVCTDEDTGIVFIGQGEYVSIELHRDGSKVYIFVEEK